MDDLLDNFANQRLDSPTEEGYKYHFVNGSPAGSQHERPEPLEMPTSAGPSPFFETPSEDEANYNADVEESDDGQGLSDGLSQHLQQFHRQDLERDQLLTVRTSPSAHSLLWLPNLLTLLNSNFIRRIKS